MLKYPLYHVLLISNVIIVVRPLFIFGIKLKDGALI